MTGRLLRLAAAALLAILCVGLPGIDCLADARRAFAAHVELSENAGGEMDAGRCACCTSAEAAVDAWRPVLPSPSAFTVAPCQDAPAPGVLPAPYHPPLSLS